MLELTRLYDWRSRYSDFLDVTRRIPFNWGTDDCAVGFAFGAVTALTGHDMAQEFRGKYDSEETAVAVMAGKGARNLGDFMALYLPEYDHPVHARIGDIGVVPDDSPLGGSLCLFDATGVVVKTSEGHGMRPREDATRAFRVGDSV